MHWTPSQIRELTMGQIIEYLKFWSPSSQKAEMVSPSAEDILMFNLESGIKTQVVKRQ